MVKKIILFGTASLFCLMFIAYSCNNNQDPTTKTTGGDDAVSIDPSLPLPAMNASLIAWDGTTTTEVTPVGNVYEVYTAQELTWVMEQTSDFSSEIVRLMEDINLDNQAFNGKDSFAGTFDGNNKTIYNININRPSVDNIGLINTLETGGIIQDLAINGGSVTGNENIGAFVGVNLGVSTTVSNVANYNVTVTGDSVAGGIIGKTDSLITIVDAVNSGSITSSDYTAGIIARSVGLSTVVTITRARNAGTINGEGGTGGIMGVVIGSVTITDAGNTGNFIGVSPKGGIIGNVSPNSTANINNSYNYATISGISAGNLVSMAQSTSTITINNTYYRNSIVPIGDIDPSATVTDNSTEITTADFTLEASFTGFDFVNVWTMGDDYPILR